MPLTLFIACAKRAKYVGKFQQEIVIEGKAQIFLMKKQPGVEAI